MARLWSVRWSLILVMGLVAAACGSGDQSAEAASDQASNVEETDGDDEVAEEDVEEQQPVSIDLDALGSSSWILRFGGGPDGEIPLVDGWPITLAFDEGKFSGTAACNGYGGAYTIDGSQIRFENVGQDEAGCEPSVQQSETAYMAALQDVDGINLVGDELALSGVSTELIFSRTESAPIEELVDRLWLLETTVLASDSTAVEGDPASLLLTADGTIVGETGCRSFMGSYLVVGNEILLTDFALEGECPNALFDQDSRVVTVLGDGFVPVIEGQNLTLSSVGNERLTYRVTTEDELSAAPSNPVPSDAEVMSGVEWIFAGGDSPEGPIVDPRTLDPEQMITLVLDGDEYGGVGVCNSYGGQAEVGSGRLMLGPAAATKRGCGEPFDAIAATYYNALPQMSEFGLEADGTRLVVNGNEIELWFERAE